MKTKEIKEFYNTTLVASDNTYEHNRWFKNAQAKSGYTSTKKALERFALPHIANGVHVFELGPGPGTWTKCLLKKAPDAEYDLVDISEEMLKQASDALSEHPNINYTTSDILDFKPGKEYDFFFCSRIIEYVPEKSEAIAIISGALKSGAYGYIVTKTPQYERPFGKSVSTAVHQQQISAKKLSALLEKYGCQVEKQLHVTCVFPKLHSGIFDHLLTTCCRIVPFRLGLPFSESYALVFRKK